MRFSRAKGWAGAILLFALTAHPLKAQTADDFFDGDVLHEIRLDINPSDWQQLRANFHDNTYYPCNFRWRGLRIDSVGIRSRGLGSRSGVKPGLKVDFDRYETTQDFLGLKSLVLDNLTQDASMLKERMAMLFFRGMGLPAPRETHTRLYVNNEYAGVYALVEPVDKRFLSRNFRENGGYLYEYVWSDFYYFDYLGADPSLYSPRPFKPQTHENNPNPAPLEAMIRIINHSSDDDFTRAIAEYLDLRLFVTHLAIENFLAEWDGILGNFGMNNFYLYRFERSNLFQFIVWDKDATFGGVLQPEDRIQYPIWQNVYDNLLARRALSVPELAYVYLETLIACAGLAGPGGKWLEDEIDRAYRQIRTAAREDTLKQCFDGQMLRPCSNEEFEAEVAFLKKFARERGDFVRRSVAQAITP